MPQFVFTDGKLTHVVLDDGTRIPEAEYQPRPITKQDLRDIEVVAECAEEQKY